MATPNHPTQPPAIVFDFGGVLMDWNPHYLYRKLFPGDEAAMERFLAEVGFSEWNQLQDAGRPFSVAVAELCARHPQYCELIQAYDQRYPESLSGSIPESVEILRQLKAAGYPLYGLSNWPDEKFELVRYDYKFFAWFDDIVISGAVGMAKPDRRIFELTLARIGRPASECLLIDDSAANIAAAQNLGFQTIHFTSPAQLAAELKVRGVLKEKG